MRTNGIGRLLFTISVVLALVAAAALWAFRNVGRWLVDPDPIQHARAIVVLSGETPFRAMEAADIYRQHWAPEVWLLRDENAESEAAFAKLGIAHPSEQDYDMQVLERLGVPEKAIRILEPPTSNTASEIARIADELQRRGGDKVILVTSPLHTRRSKVIWHTIVGDFPPVVLRYAAAEPGDPDHWWRSTQDIQDVEHEVLGLIDAHLGFVAKPRQ